MIEDDNWLIAIHADACPFIEAQIETCLLLAEPEDKCNKKNCPRKLILGNGFFIEEVRP